MFTPVLASTGPFTATLEAIATAVGSGALAGGFGLGVVGSARGRSRQASEAMALTGGNVGGLVGLALLGIDIVTKYVV
jgi:hypothetical protein